MKKYFKYLSFCVLAGVGLSSCEPDDNGYKPDPVDVEGYAYLTDPSRSITVLDQDQELSIELMTAEGVSFESVEIQLVGEDAEENPTYTKIADANISGETATFSTARLGEFLFPNDDGELTELTGSFTLRIVSTLSNGMEVIDNATIAVGHAIHLEGPAELEYMDRTREGDTLTYSVEPFGATVDDLTLEYKTTEDAEYVADDITSIDLAAALSEEGGEIALTELDYEAYGLMPGDTLFYQFTASSGDLTDVVRTNIVIAPQAFTDGGAGTLSNDGGKLDLMTGEGVPAAAEGGDITFAATGSVAAPGFEVVETSDIRFVPVSLTEDQVPGGHLAQELFEAGTPVTTVSNVSNGDVFAYKVTREIEDEENEGETITVVHYGFLEIGAISRVDGETVSFEVESSEGTVAGVEAETES